MVQTALSTSTSFGTFETLLFIEFEFVIIFEKQREDSEICDNSFQKPFLSFLSFSFNEQIHDFKIKIS